MQNLKQLIALLEEIASLAACELERVSVGKQSAWNAAQLKLVVIPEINRLLQHARAGVVFLKYGEKQRLLESTYLMTDSLVQLDASPLGKKITKLQEWYNSL